MRPSAFELELEDLRIDPRMSSVQRDLLASRVNEARRSGRPVSLLYVHAPTDPSRWLDDSASISALGDGLYLVVLPRCHIDRGCAVAERLVRLARDARVRVGVAQVLPHTPNLYATLERAEEALNEAFVAGPVASMHWADPSRDPLIAI